MLLYKPLKKTMVHKIEGDVSIYIFRVFSHHRLLEKPELLSWLSLLDCSAETASTALW